MEAMRLVRDALGDDAIIVATREEEGGVRLTAAIDDVEEPPLPPPSSYDPEPALGGHGYDHGRDHGRNYRREPEIDVVDLVCDALGRHGTPPLITDRLLNTISTYDTVDLMEALSAALDSIFTFQPLPLGRAPRPHANRSSRRRKDADHRQTRHPLHDERPQGRGDHHGYRAGGRWISLPPSPSCSS